MNLHGILLLLLAASPARGQEGAEITIKGGLQCNGM